MLLLETCWVMCSLPQHTGKAKHSGKQNVPQEEECKSSHFPQTVLPDQAPQPSGGGQGRRGKPWGSLKHHYLKTEGRFLTATQQQISFTDSHEGLDHAP